MYTLEVIRMNTSSKFILIFLLLLFLQQCMPTSSDAHHSAKLLGSIKSYLILNGRGDVAAKIYFRPKYKKIQIVVKTDLISLDEIRRIVQVVNDTPETISVEVVRE